MRPGVVPRLLGLRVLVVDDEHVTLNLLERFLEREGYTHIRTLGDSRRVISEFDEMQPDLVILDLHMPHVGGMGVLDFITSSVPPHAYLPVLVITGDHSTEARHRALELGASDFLTKPLDLVEAGCRVRNLLHARHLHLELEARNNILEMRVAERTRELRDAHVETLERLARAAEYSDDDPTGLHCWRVGEMAGRIAELMALPPAQVSLLRRAAQLHDVGMLGVPEGIRRKQGELTDDEEAVLRTHTVVGGRILSGGGSELMRMAETIARAHHERWDGSGYPRGLRGDAIPVEARIVAVADLYERRAAGVPGEPRPAPGEVVRHVRAQSGRALDPAVVQAFLKLPLGDELAFPPARPMAAGAA